MNISVIIPVLNEASILEAAVTSAWKTDCDEVIVVDGGSTDSTVDIGQDLKCKMITAESGRGVQLNTGVHHATGDIFLFLHADNRLAPDACQHIRQIVAEQNSVGSGAFDELLLFGGFQQQINATGWIYRWIKSGNSLRAKYQGLVYGDQGIFVSRKAYELVGGFPDFPIMEDFAFSKKLSRIIWPIMLDGPLMVDARRWNQQGPLRQTLRNWLLASAFRLGVSPEKLVNFIVDKMNFDPTHWQFELFFDRQSFGCFCADSVNSVPFCFLFSR